VTRTALDAESTTREPALPARIIDDRDARAAGQVHMTNISWAASEALPFERWVVAGRRLGMIGRGVGWWIGDWLRFGNARYGEKYVQAARITGYDVQTLMNMVYVASSIDQSRRREELSWSHHAEVAALAPEEQDRWLDTANEARLSVQDMRQMLRSQRKRNQEGAGAECADVPAPKVICPECGHKFLAHGDD
jgi:hypothetical protein